MFPPYRMIQRAFSRWIKPVESFIRLLTYVHSFMYLVSDVMFVLSERNSGPTHKAELARVLNRAALQLQV